MREVLQQRSRRPLPVPLLLRLRLLLSVRQLHCLSLCVMAITHSRPVLTLRRTGGSPYLTAPTRALLWRQRPHARMAASWCTKSSACVHAHARCMVSPRGGSLAGAWQGGHVAVDTQPFVRGRSPRIRSVGVLAERQVGLSPPTCQRLQLLPHKLHLRGQPEGK